MASDGESVALSLPAKALKPQAGVLCFVETLCAPLVAAAANEELMRRIGAIYESGGNAPIVSGRTHEKTLELRRSVMAGHEKINYVEFPAKDLTATKAFFTSAFGWSFVDYGPDYAAFSNQGIDGGFFASDLAASTDNGSALIVLFSDNLEDALSRVVSAGGEILKPIYTFPGGRRFHFADPSGNELAVWGELD